MIAVSRTDVIYTTHAQLNNIYENNYLKMLINLAKRTEKHYHISRSVLPLYF